MRKIGILGGSFNPVHMGHLRLAVVVREQLGLDRLDLIPAAIPPHKKNDNLLPFDFRIALLEAAITGREGLWVNPLERDRPGPSYTVDTLRQYSTDEPDSDLFFVIGATDLLTLPSWHEWREICSLANLVVADREGRSVEDIEKFLLQNIPGSTRKDKHRWQLASGPLLQHVSLPRLDVSSTMIRSLLRQERSVAYLVPERVEQLLGAHGPQFF